MTDAYSGFAEFYDRLMSDVDYEALAEYFHGIIRESWSGKTPPLLLDLACGTGRLSVLMANRGYDVIGVDASPEMLSCANHHENVSYICQDMTELDLYGTIDACICSLDGLNHLPDEAALQKALQRVALFMNPSGVLVFDMNTIHKHETILSNNIFIKEIENIYCVWRNFYKDKGIVDIVLDIFDEGYARHTVEIKERAYGLGTIRQHCAKAGFSVIEIYDFMKKTKAEKNSEKVVFVCKKITNQQ